MYVAAGDTKASSRGVLSFMPSSLRKYMYRINFEEAYEIRMSLGKPLMIYYSDGCYYLNSTGVLTKSTTGAVKITGAHIDEALEIAAKSSLYAKQESIRRGFITLDGGHRIGIAGSGVIENGNITFIKDISTLNYRLACEVKGVSDGLIKNIYSDGDIKNTLIIAPPGAGKTTLLRDTIYSLSQKGMRISVVDERSELAAMSGGRPRFDIGINTDVLDGVPKSEGMIMMLRSMSPQIIAADEIGTLSDIKAIETAMNSGVRIITTIHGFNIQDVKRRSEFSVLFSLFDVFAVLSRDTKTMEFKMKITYNERTKECSEQQLY